MRVLNRFADRCDFLLWRHCIGMTVVLGVLFCFVGCAKQENASPKPEGQLPTAQPTSSPAGQTPSSGSPAKPEGSPEAGQPTYFVAIEPHRPTSLCSIKAKIVGDMAGDVQVVYTWRLNGKILSEATSDTLSCGAHKKGDSVVAIATLTRQSRIIGTYESRPVTIVSAPPVLTMTEPKVTNGDTVTIQLRGESPDGLSLVYALEPPRLSGMTIDSQSGKAVWKVPARVKNAYQFTASVTDSDGTKTVKTFEFHVDVK